MIRPEDLKKMTPAQRAALSRKEVNTRLQGQMKKPKPIKPITPGKKNLAPKPRAVRLRDSKPVPMPKPRERTYPNGKPAPMPTRVPNLSLPPDQRASAKRIPPGLRKKGKSSSVAATPKPRKKI